MQTTAEIAVVGAGIGGLALAGILARQGVRVTIYEQARQFERVGAGIQMSPNAMRVLRSLGLEERLRRAAFTPPNWAHRARDSGEPLSDLVLGPEAEQRFGAPYLLMHRGDLHRALQSTIDPAQVRFKKELVGLDHRGSRLRLTFSDGTSASADAVIGADGVHSRVREVLYGREAPSFTGRVAHRTTFPASRIPNVAVGTCTKWWGPDRHIVIYPVTAAADEIYYVTSVPDPDWDIESWSAQVPPLEVIDAMTGFHPDVQAVVRATPTVHKWALFERDPLPRWTDGSTVLMGDACHPMTPYMAQGAASALEDAAVLARCLGSCAEPASAFATFEASRRDRTSRIQLTSRENSWGRTAHDTSWVYRYDALTAPLVAEGSPSPGC